MTYLASFATGNLLRTIINLITDMTGESGMGGENGTDYSNNIVTRAQFHKDHLQPGKYNFTLWEWLYLVQKLTREYLKDSWVDG